MLGSIVTDLLTQLCAVKKHWLNIAETGTMYYTKLEPGETDLRERSTMAIATWMAKSKYPHLFTSIDGHGQHILACQLALGPDLAKHVNHIRANGKHGLLSAGVEYPFDFVLLDADSDGDVIAQEFYAVHRRMNDNGIIVIDDAFKHRSVNKARVIIDSKQFEYYPLRKQAIGVPFGDAARRILQAFK